MVNHDRDSIAVWHAAGKIWLVGRQGRTTWHICSDFNMAALGNLQTLPIFFFGVDRAFYAEPLPRKRSHTQKTTACNLFNWESHIFISSNLLPALPDQIHCILGCLQLACSNLHALFGRIKEIKVCPYRRDNSSADFYIDWLYCI